MLSTFPATGFPESSSLGNPFPPFETGFPPWDTHEPPFLFLPTLEDNEPFIFNPNPSQEPVTSNSGSNKSKPASRVSNRKKPENPSFGSHETTSCLDTIIDERKRKRMISNRESARRSRKRKQKHLEDMMSQSNRLSVENRELMNRLRLVVHEDRLVRRENELLELEYMMLRQRLWDISQVLIVRHNLNTSAWPCNNFTSINDGQLSNHGYSLIT